MRRPLLLGLFAAVPLSGGVAAQETEIIVEAPTLQHEIERILAADNLDPTNLTARQVADALEQIRRGGAPDDFWKSYRKHVAAWRRYADAEASPRLTYAEFRATERAINATFDEAERVALRYGARPPPERNRWRPPDE